MRYALVKNESCEAKNGLAGICPDCFQPVIAKCGTRRVHHWAHCSGKECSNFKEPKTEWHYKWQDEFPKECQEQMVCDKQTGERFRADVLSQHGIVIEFQHSHIDPQERIAREKFYKKMFWVVDGTRLKRDYPRFMQACENRIFKTKQQGFYYISYSDECFPRDWTESEVPVVFDFKGLVTAESQEPFRETLWCLLPKRKGMRDLLIGMSRADFVANHHNYLSQINEPVNTATSKATYASSQTPRFITRPTYSRRHRHL